MIWGMAVASWLMWDSVLVWPRLRRRALWAVSGSTSEGGEDVAGLGAAGAAGAAAAGGDAFHVELEQDALALDAGEADVEVVGQAARPVGGAVEADRVDALAELAPEGVAERPDVGGAAVALVGGELQGAGEARGGGDVFGAGAALFLLAAAEHGGLERGAAAVVEQADAFGSVDFVGGERHEVDAEDVGADVDGAGGLDGVGVDDGAPVALFDGAADLGDGLERADFVVGGHD